MITEVEALSYRRRYRGLIGVKSKMPIRDMSVLSRIYTPGVGAVCREIEKHPVASYQLTCRGNSIALISDGSPAMSTAISGPWRCCPNSRPRASFTRPLPTWTPCPLP